MNPSEHSSLHFPNASKATSTNHEKHQLTRKFRQAQSSFHRWRERYGGMTVDAKRLKEVESENATLKRLLADAEVENSALREIAK